MSLSVNNQIINVNNHQQKTQLAFKSKTTPIKDYPADTIKIKSLKKGISKRILAIGSLILTSLSAVRLFKTRIKEEELRINNIFTPFDKSELKDITKHLQDFINNEFATSTKIIQKPKVTFYKKVNSAGKSNPLTNEIMINPEILTSKDFYKLVNDSGKCIEDKNVLWQITGSRSMLEEEIEKQGLKKAKILPLTREERLKIAKATIIHEAFHCIQIQNMILHPNIGLEKMVKDFLDPFMNTNGIKFKIINAIAKSSWKELLKIGKKLDPNSELAKRTMKQYRGLLFAKRNQNESLRYKIYATLPTEKEAYELERNFAIAHDLLI